MERIFSRLMALYGKQFSAMWQDTDLEDVKAVWTDKLGGFNAYQIGGALLSCDSKPFPPNLPEFIALCRQSHAPIKAQLEHKLTSEQIAANKVKIEEAVQTVTKPQVDHKLWAKRIKAREAKGDRTLSAIQIRFANEALREMH